jgi:hypothetical protein
MNIQEYENKKQEFGIEGTGIDTTTKEDRTWKDKVTQQPTFTIPAGSKVHVDFSPKVNSANIFITYKGETKISRTVQGNHWLKGIAKPPTLNTLEKRMFDGISRSVTGKKVEADGYSYDGSPSWELVLGFI